ncbi:hypothetical protein GCM10028778_24090 [Barrientosiimonas marina]|uniref:Uncharacterized protein n=1 Tax=Lentibacillus kimchii TaxID=1542911 RepID=A0ABW2UY75_9BACI
MGWLLAIVVVAIYILAVYLLDRMPNVSLILAIIIPFGLFWALGRFGGEVIFTIFASIVLIVMNVLSRSRLDD